MMRTGIIASSIYKQTIPNAPSGALVVHNTANNTLDMSWVDNSNNETAFELQYWNDVAGAYQSFPDRGEDVTTSTWLNASDAYTSGEMYKFRVRSKNEHGVSEWAVSNEIILQFVPDAPVSVEASFGLTDPVADYDVSWTHDGVDTDSFTIEVNVNSLGWVERASGIVVNSYADPTEYNTGDTVQYRVKAINENGSSSYTESPIYNTPEVPPETPSSLLASFDINDGKYDLDWTNNADNADTLHVEVTTNGGTTWTNLTGAGLSPGATSFTDPTIRNKGTNLEYRVRAENEAGFYDYAYSGPLTAPEHIPAAPVSISPVTDDSDLANQRIQVSWVEASNNEDDFEIQVSVNGGAYGALTVALSGVSGYSYTNTHVSEGNTLIWRIRARNEVGNSAWTYSDPYEVPVVQPNAPSGVSASFVGDYPVVTWNDNSYNEDEFIIEREYNLNGSWASIGSTGRNDTNITHSGITQGNDSVRYRVKASNESGDSAYSAPSASLEIPDPPGQPTNSGTALDHDGNGSTAHITLFWAANINGGDADGYEVEKSINNTTSYSLVADGELDRLYNDPTAYSYGTTVYYRIRAYNTGGVSPWETTQQSVEAPLDSDGDGLYDYEDPFPYYAGDDYDGDGYVGEYDYAPYNASYYGYGYDSDYDGYKDLYDAYPYDPNYY